MRKKKSVDKRSLSSTGSPEMNMNLELDITALRGKNKQLIQAVAKLQQEKAMQLTQIATLQEEFFNLNSKYVNLKKIFSTIDATTRGCFPKQLELVNAFGKIIQLCAVGTTVNNPNKDTKTQAVKPHIVNGHVLQNPTITLSRFNDNESHTPPRQPSGSNSPNNSGGNDFQVSPIRSSNNSNSSPNDVRPSTSRMLSRTNGTRFSGQENNLDDMVQNCEPVASRRTVNMERLDLSNMNEEEDNGLDTPEEDEGDTTDQDYRSRLVTIQEEDEEAYNSTIRSLDNIQISFTDRVREIKILLDPLPKECIKLLANVEKTVNRTSSLVGEPSTSVLDPNNTLLNESSTSEDTMEYATRESQNFSFKRTPTKRKSGHLAEPSCSSSRLEVPDLENIQVSRGKLKKLEGVSSQKFDESPGTMSFSSSISAIHNLGTETPLNNSTNVDLENSQDTIMNSLGLEPNNLRLTTSTPVAGTPRTSSRIKKLSVSLNSTKKKTPVDSKVTKRRGGSDDKKMAQVLIKKLSLEKRLSSGSPIKKIEQLLNTSPITRASDIKKKGKTKKKNIPKKSQESENSVASSSCQTKKTPEPSRKEKQQTKNKNVNGKTKGKENRQTKTPVQQIITSPRPSRAARPKVLKEPSLGKKMRRSR